VTDPITRAIEPLLDDLEEQVAAFLHRLLQESNRR